MTMLASKNSRKCCPSDVAALTQQDTQFWLSRAASRKSGAWMSLSLMVLLLDKMDIIFGSCCSSGMRGGG
jgi:hypothetical protein